MTTPLTITIQSLRDYEACDLDARVAGLTRHLGRTPADDEPIPVRTWWDLPSTSLDDRFWSLRATNDAVRAKRLCITSAIQSARRVLRMTGDLRTVSETCIVTAEAWLADPTEERRRACGAARAAARAAAWAAAWDAAGDAAWAAAWDAAGDAAGDAAWAAARAAAWAAARDAAGDAAGDAAWARQRQDLDELLALADVGAL